MLKKFFYYNNEFNHIQELQKIDGYSKIENQCNFFKELIKKYLTFIMIVILSGIIFNFSYIFLNISVFMLTLNFISIYIANENFRKLYKSFILFCQSIVKLEGYIKLILKINSDKNILNENLGNLIKNLENSNLTNYFQDVDGLRKTNPWEYYLKLKRNIFSVIFAKYSEYYCKENKFYIQFLIEFYNLFKISHSINELSRHINKSCSNIKSNYENCIKNETDQIKLTEQITKICKNLSQSEHKNLNFVNQIADIISNNRSLDDNFLDLILLLQNDSNKQEILKKFELILELNYNRINAIKQIKYNFNNLNLNIEEECTRDEKLNPIISCENKNGISLYEIELNDNFNKPDEKEKTVNFPTFNHYEILTRVDEYRSLQINLINDLEEFQRTKIENNTQSDIILERDTDGGINLDKIF